MTSTSAPTRISARWRADPLQPGDRGAAARGAAGRPDPHREAPDQPAAGGEPDRRGHLRRQLPAETTPRSTWSTCSPGSRASPRSTTAPASTRSGSGRMPAGWIILGLTDDVGDAVMEQNQNIAAGKLGQALAPRARPSSISSHLGRLTEVEQFADNTVRADPDGWSPGQDVSRVEMAARTMAGTPSSTASPPPRWWSAAGRRQRPGDQEGRPRDHDAAGRELSRTSRSINYDGDCPHRGIDARVVHTLIEAVALVFIVALSSAACWHACSPCRSR